MLLEQIVAAGIDTRTVTTIELPVETATDCALDFLSRDRYLSAAPIYETEVASILIERCVSCHDGGTAAFAMNSHQMVRGWSPMTKEVVMTGAMPPMHVNPDVRLE